MTRIQKNRRVASLVAILSFAMFGFGYALIPLYDIICDITGLNGRTGVVETEEIGGVLPDKDRLITVQFVANVNSQLPWDFAPTQTKMQVHPGKIYETTFSVRNRSDMNLVGQAVPSVSPNKAALHFNKTECFCFTKQALKPKEIREMPVHFVINRGLPSNVQILTLAYTFFLAK